MRRFKSLLFIGTALLVVGAAAAPAVGAGPPLTFTRDVAPILFDKCSRCHRVGGGAPMPLTTYREVRPWLRAIRQRVSAREMPPWHAARGIGIDQFKNDRSLTDGQIESIVAWIDAGASEGNPRELPTVPAPADSATGWAIGTPDLVVTADAEHVMYARGQDWWVDHFGDPRLTEDRWVKAVEIKAGNPRIVHHAVAFVADPARLDEGISHTQQLALYVPGAGALTFAENTGKLLKAGSLIRFNMHYSPSGTVEKDRSSIAFVFYPRGVVPQHSVETLFITAPAQDLDIPAHARVVHETEWTLPRHALVRSFAPHMHLRGSAAILEAVLPDETVQLLNVVDRYDFHWQTTYQYTDAAAPVLPAGTVVRARWIHDNTAANRRNPDPWRWVGWGQSSMDEMAGMYLDVSWITDSDFRSLIAARPPRPSSGASDPERMKAVLSRVFADTVAAPRHGVAVGSIAPVFDGVEIAEDGDYLLWFGYVNRGIDPVDLSIKDTNRFEPGLPDRGQPTHFSPGRHKDVFAVRVPRDVASQKLVWRITAHGHTESVTARIDPRAEITRKYSTAGGTSSTPVYNTPPAVRLSPVRQQIGFGEPATFSLTARDDGMPKRLSGASIGMIRWVKYRGPGKVTFETRPPNPGGPATALARFSEPGEYEIDVLVDDGSGPLRGQFDYHCCWTNARATVVVSR